VRLAEPYTFFVDRSLGSEFFPAAPEAEEGASSVGAPLVAVVSVEGLVSVLYAGGERLLKPTKTAETTSRQHRRTGKPGSI
jgi:hypothetical protein